MSSPADRSPAEIVSKRRAFGQVIVCQGCCCGRTDRGFPEVPVERLKAAWKARRLNRAIQLTISGCVGPCDVANVAMIVTPQGASWIGGLSSGDDFDAVVRWAESCDSAGELVPLPIELARRRFNFLVPTPRPGEGQDPLRVAVGIGGDRTKLEREDADG